MLARLVPQERIIAHPSLCIRALAGRGEPALIERVYDGPRPLRRATTCVRATARAVARAADEDVGRAVADVGAAAALRALVLAGGAGQALALRRRALAAVRQLGPLGHVFAEGVKVLTHNGPAEIARFTPAGGVVVTYRNGDGYADVVNTTTTTSHTATAAMQDIDGDGKADGFVALSA